MSKNNSSSSTAEAKINTTITTQKAVISDEKGLLSGQKSNFKTVLSLVMTPINIVITLSVIKSAPFYIKFLLPLIKQNASFLNFEDKIAILIMALFYFACFYFSVIVLTIFLRITLFKAANPLTQEDPIVIVACQRVLTNSLEQFVVFLANIAYFVIFNAQPEDKMVVLSWIAVFIGSRILFSLGYIFGAMINFTMLRQCGFMIGLVLNLLLIVHNLGIINILFILS